MSNKLSVFVALDRSGSMQGKSWSNAIESLNEYVKGLQKEKIDGDITVIAFDSINSTRGSTIRLTPVCENTSLAYFEQIKTDVLTPAGCTPLFDAAAHVMDLALERNSERSVVVILTDGYENASTEYTQVKIKDKVKTLEAKKWEVIFLGANFDVSHYTAGSGLTSSKMRNFDINNTQQRTSMYTDLAAQTVAYTNFGAAIDMTEKSS